ncbi:MAG: hypothetical protein EOP32_21775 [Rhodococcus sp. (in: high G+C Gram-positive bacteria)]|nr:MAG: hypothetical protein EOP32_21775 [Rhodococcus sp. (in: high G+C Gram-positive bacteria)]
MDPDAPDRVGQLIAARHRISDSDHQSETAQADPGDSGKIEASPSQIRFRIVRILKIVIDPAAERSAVIPAAFGKQCEDLVIQNVYIVTRSEHGLPKSELELCDHPPCRRLATPRLA